MKKAIPILLLSCSLTGAYAQTGYNLDFEDLNTSTGLPTGWGLGNVRSADIPTDNSISGYKADDQVKQHGRYALLIDWTKGYKEWTASNYVISKTFKGKTIKLTGFVKTENTAEGCGLWMRLDGKDYQNLGFDNMHDRFIKGTTDWKEYTVELPYDQEQVKSIVVGGLITGSGKMWMDNLHITIDDKDISEATVYTPALTKAEMDSAFNKGSGINDLMLSTRNLHVFVNLGMLWGFIKYYHANVQTGNYNMDAELFRILPKIIAAENTNAAYAIMEKWVDMFGKPEPSKDNKDFQKTAETKLAPDYGFLFNDNNLPKSLIDKLTYIKRNRSSQTEHYYIGMQPSVGNPIFKHEYSYYNSPYPDAGTRLLSVYRYWNMIQYFFPDKHLIGEDWNNVLGGAIFDFCNAKDTLEYQIACLKLIARIHDTHANVWGGGTAIQKMKGDLMPPFRAEFIENKLVITDYTIDTMNIKNIVKTGDIIERIDGIPVQELITKYAPLTPASNYETQLRDMPGTNGFLLRGNGAQVMLTIDRNGTKYTVPVPRIDISRLYGKKGGNKPDIAFKMLADSIGYIYPAKLADKDVETIKNQFYKAKGIIIDMRCYPSSFMPFTYGNWFKEKVTPFVRFTGGSVDMPGLIEISEPLKNGKDFGNHFKGKLVIIVNAETQSQAEYTTMALGSTPGAVVIGSTTAGADGNVSDIFLPGGIRTMISGLGVLYPDGTETQRSGVRIDKEVKPTIKGIQDGRDEPLEAAIKIIKG